MLETTGIRPAARWSSTGCGSTVDDVADAAEVVLDAVDDDAAAAAAEQAGVLTAQPGGARTVLVDLADELRVDLAGQHHPHDADRLGAGDAVPALELAGDREPIEHRRDLRSAAVHDDGLDPDIAEVGDVGGEGILQLFRHHRVAAVLDHDDLIAEAAQPRQRLDEGGGLRARLAGIGVLDVDVGHEEYALFSWT